MRVDFLGMWAAACLDTEGKVLWVQSLDNDIVTAALTDILSVYFASGTPKPNWYAGLISTSGYSALSAGDTAGSHSGWTEDTSYSESTRRAWSPTISGGVARNSAQMTFTFPSEATLRGLFLISNATRGGSSGTLWSTALFPLVRTMPAGSVLRLTYILTAAGGG